jgi:hypothetical protein
MSTVVFFFVYNFYVVMAQTDIVPLLGGDLSRA